MKNRVMVTGSTGFIGSSLIANKPLGLEIITPRHEDLLNPKVELPKVDYIIHAAGYAAPALFMANPLSTVQVNTATVIRLLGCFETPGAFLFCSSSEIYRGLTHAATEEEIGTTTPYHPRACYIEGKRCGETIINVCREVGFRAMSARIGLTYGPGTRVNDARVLNQFIQKAFLDKAIRLQDDGSAIVSYGYSDDIARMLWKILLHGTQAVYNVAGTHKTTIRDLALLIGKKLHAEVYWPDTPKGVGQAQMDLTRYCKEFGMPEYTPFNGGLDWTIEYQRSLYDV